MSKLIGYIIALIGIIILALTMLNIISIPGIKQPYIMVAGVAIVIIGVFLSLGKSERQLKEVPIYEGEGKKRKIVAYKRMK